MGQRAIGEFLGTYFLVLTVALVTTGPAAGSLGALAPLVVASVLAAMIYALGHVCKAHFNPAVSIAFVVAGEMEARALVPYLMAQVAGAAAAAMTASVFATVDPVVPMTIDVGPALLAEFLFTFALVFVVLHVATAPALKGNDFYGVAIALVVLVGAATVGSVSGAAFNPAVAVGLGITGVVRWEDLWVHGAAELAGGLAAAPAMRMLVKPVGA